MSMPNDYLGKDVKKLGFGLMRLPKLADGAIDVEQVKTMADRFLESGFTYFDTAYVYDGGESEKAAKAALVDRYPRDSFTLATKLNVFSPKSGDEAKEQFDISRERCGVEYFDFYLLHNINEGTIDKFNDWDIWNFVAEKKAAGQVKHMGFSFHGHPELLEATLDAHPEVEFVQLQVNYADMEDPSVEARRNVEICQERGIPFVIMEPVKGGSLANPPSGVAAVFDEANPEVSYPSWAIRFAASFDGVLTVLSGMSSIEQMEDNLSYMTDFKPLDESERAVIARAQEEISAIDSIKCTACKYCVEGCPMQIPIPDIFEAMNRKLIWENEEGAKDKYSRIIAEASPASACIACGQCEAACPQSLTIIDYLARVTAELE